MTNNTLKIQRVLKAPVAVVYKAFVDSDARCKWLPPYGFTARSYENEVKVGGTFKMSFINFRTGHEHSFSGTYLEIKPNELLRYDDKFDDPNLPGVIEVTISFKEVSCGTEINVIQENIPAPIPLELCYLGWQESMSQLASLVEPNIP